MLVVRSRIPRLRRKKAAPRCVVGVVGDQRPAAAGCDDLVAVEGQRRRRAVAPRRASVVCRPERLGRVLDEDDAAFAANRLDAVVVGTLPVQVNGDDRLDGGCVPVCIIEYLGKEIRVDVPRSLLAVDEDRLRSRVLHRVGGGRKRQALYDYPIPGADAGLDEREVQCRSTR